MGQKSVKSSVCNLISRHYLVKKGDTAKAKITVHSGKYDANGVETGNITAEATITAVDPEVVTVNSVC